ncbi:unnamed protein product [Rhizophagus irregularis]|nr:unnamed protein product [Rhizophagus irregularis]
MARAKVSSYFINIRPEEWKISEFYEYRQKEKDFPSSFQKETFILRRSLDYLMKDGSPEAKNYATLLDKNSRQVMFVAEEAVHLSQKTSHVAAEEVQAERRLPKTAWVSLEPSKEKFKTTRQDKWQIIKPLLKKHQKL